MRVSLSKRILFPISLSLMAILIVGILAFQIQYRSGISGLANERLKNIEGQIQEEIRHKTRILSSLLLLKNDIWIGEHLSRKNRSALLNMRNSQNDPGDRAIIQAIIAMGHSMGLKIVAEGVEIKAHYDLVKQAGCDFAQGYYIQKPVAVKELLSDPITLG